MIIFSNGQHQLNLGRKYQCNMVNKLGSAAECENDYQGIGFVSTWQVNQSTLG